jgi:PDZ domain-containing protein
VVSRRALTLLLACVLALGLAIAGLAQAVPYVALTPGPAYNTLGAVGGTEVLTISGRPTYKTDGALDLTTVSVKDRITLFEAVVGWVSPRQAVVPREVVFPPDTSAEQEREQTKQEMVASQDAATTAALRQLGYPSTTKLLVAQVQTGAPADGKLQPGDVLTHVDGTPVATGTALRAAIAKHEPGEAVVLGYVRDGKPATVSITTELSTDDGPRRPVIGIGSSEQSSFPVTVDIRLKDVGGPSAGLMFALGIIDKLGPDSLTGGRTIAGTGEITAEGEVGPIGGVAQKMLGAKEQKATVFLSPAQNCAEARATKPEGLTLVRVATLKDALAALRMLRDGGTPPSC